MVQYKYRCEQEYKTKISTSNEKMCIKNEAVKELEELRKYNRQMISKALKVAVGAERNKEKNQIFLRNSDGHDISKKIVKWWHRRMMKQ